MRPFNSPIDLQPGDALLYGDGTLLSRLIKFRTWSDISHIEIYVGDGWSVASRSEGVGKYAFRRLGLQRVMRPIIPLDLEKGMEWFKTVDGTAYGWADLLRFYLINVPTKGLICSELSDQLYQHSNGVFFNVDYPSGAICPRDYETISSRLMKQVWSAAQ